MAERKPPDLDFESWVDRKIREATERGDFDNLPGQGEPLPGAGTGYLEENWWLRDYLRREGVSAEGALPPSLALRREVEKLPDAVDELTSEQEVREVVSSLNRRIVEWLRVPRGPHVPIAPVDPDGIVEHWLNRRSSPPVRQQLPGSAAPTAATTPLAVQPQRSTWWRRFIGRAFGRRGVRH